MFQGFKDGLDFFKERKWLWASALVAVVVLGALFKLPSAGGSLPTEEPEISLYMHESGETKTMPMETYLQGVVAAEMDPTWPLQALEAQAIVARTFTLKKMATGPLPERGTDASTDPKEFQAYNESRVNENVKLAVADTKGQVITYGGKPIMAWFHASSGGKTATASEGLDFSKERTPYIKSVADVQEEPAHEWRFSFAVKDVEEALKTLGFTVTDINTVKIGRKGPSGRAETLKINDIEVSAPSLRLAIGSEKMRSTLLDSVSLEGDKLHMQGRGFGHGVGMSQWGAWIMAQRGKTAQEIITYYFKGVNIKTAWE